MRRNSIFAFIIVSGILLLSTSGAVAQDYKKAIEKMAESIASSIRQEARRKVTTLDFTTQQGEVNEFGRYISELVSMEYRSKAGCTIFL